MRWPAVLALIIGALVTSIALAAALLWAMHV